MKLSTAIGRERFGLRRHGVGYICARLVPLCAGIVGLYFAWLSLELAHEMFFGAPDHGLRWPLLPRQREILVSHSLAACAALFFGALARELWLFSLQALWLAITLSAVMVLHVLQHNPYSPAWLGAGYILVFLLVCASYRTFKIDSA